MKRYTLALLVALSVPALAQQQLTPAQQAAANMGSQIGLLMQANAELTTQVQQLTARVKALEDKYEPKEPPK